MQYSLEDVFEKYPNPFFLVKPVIKNGKSEDFFYEYVNPAFAMFIGKSSSELIGHTFVEAFGKPGEDFWLKLFMDTSVKKQLRYVENVSTIIDRTLTVEAFYVEPEMCACIIRDYAAADKSKVTVQTENVLQNKAYQDPLTGAFNRFHLQENEHNYCKAGNIGIAYFDINHLKYTNDHLGHHAGDQLINWFAKDLRDNYPKSYIYRLGGDEFLVLQLEVEKDEFLKKCSEYKKSLETSGASAMGFGFYEDTSNIWKCIDDCDQSMYEHKKKMKKK